MILVTCGSSHLPFDRLLRAIDELTFDEPVIVQHGPSPVRPARARCIDFLPLDDLAGLVRDARAVVTHGGVGSILLTLMNGKRPFVVPRQRTHGESVDDHQLESAHRFERAGMAMVVADPADLGAAIARACTGTMAAPVGEEVPLVTELRSYIAAAAKR
jgi:UDP-N-acetylglucosamine transferase subunit ALG13